MARLLVSFARRAAVAVASCVFALCVVTASAALCPAAPAFAASSDAEAADDNLVNPQQMPDSSFIYDTSIADLDKADSYLDGQTVQITGEVVGDRINAELDSDHCWLMLEAIDGSYAEMAVYVPQQVADVVDTYGAYGKRGTVLQVRGTFNLACDEHEGLSDLHVDHYSVVSRGSEEKEPFDVMKFVPGAVLCLLGGVAVFAFYRMRERQR